MRLRPSHLFVLPAVALVLALLAPAAPAAAPGADLGPLVTIAIQQAKLTAGDAADDGYFGWSVAVDGDTAVVGANEETVDGNYQQGAAYVFTRSAGVWTQQQELTAADGAAWDRFGAAVAVSGDTAVVGAYFKTVGGNAVQGAAYVFTRSAGVWTEQQRLTIADGAAWDEFGCAVAVSADTTLVGALGTDVGAHLDQGAAYVFTRSAGVWTQQQRLAAAEGASDDGFGGAVALSGDTALVGACDKTVGGRAGQGAAYVFTRSAGVWTQQQGLAPSDGAAGDRFGYAVALSGDTALVGADLKTIGGNVQQGAAYVYSRSTGTWSQQQRLIAGDGAASDYFGHAVALSNDTALIGAYGKDVGYSQHQGVAYLVSRSGVLWTQQQELTATGGISGDYFGWAVALSGETALLGAYYGADPGAAYVFTSVAPPTETIGAPTAAGSWPSGSTQTVSWSLDAPVPAGEFRVSLVNQATSAWYVNKSVASDPTQTVYSTQVIAAVPAGPYKAAVYWKPSGAPAWAIAVKSAAFTVTPINITVPGATTVWPTQAACTVSWNVNPDMAVGEFQVSLIDQATRIWYVNKIVPAVAARTSYSTSVNTIVPAGTYKAAVYWRSAPGAAWGATQKSAAFTIATLAVSDPTAASSWPRLSTQNVAWSVTPGLAAGEFRVSLVNAVTNVWYVNKVVAVVPGQLPYSTSIVANVPAGSYKAAVYWRPAGSATWVLTKKTAAFTVTP